MSTITVNDQTAGVDEPIFPRVRSKRGEPTWELAERYPRQGEWTEEDYFALEADYFVEFVDGVLEFLPMPTLSHQDIVEFLHEKLKAYVNAHRLGKVRFAPLPVRLFKGRIREPDLVYLNRDQVKAAKRKYPRGADLIVEVVSPDDKSRKRDLKDKPVDYAKAGVKEYWIVEPELLTIKVLTLSGKKYKTHGEFKPGQTATSVLFDGFSVQVDDVFAAADDSDDAPLNKSGKSTSRKDNGR